MRSETTFTRARVWLGLLAAVSAFAAVCPVLFPIDARGAEAIPPPHVIKPSNIPDSDATPVTIDLAVDGNRTVGGGIVATLAVMARKSLEPVQLQIVLPDGVQQTAGDAAWEGAMTAGEIRMVKVSARLLTPGSKKFLVRVTLPPDTAGGTAKVVTMERSVDVQPAPAEKPKK